MRNQRATGKLCPCGSGLPGKYDLSIAGYRRILCRKCEQPIEHKREYKQYQGDDAKRQAEARRRIEERRELQEIER